eukprot:3935664-Rhodomonas_salina.1
MSGGQIDIRAVMCNTVPGCTVWSSGMRQSVRVCGNQIGVTRTMVDVRYSETGGRMYQLLMKLLTERYETRGSGVPGSGGVARAASSGR